MMSALGIKLAEIITKKIADEGAEVIKAALEEAKIKKNFDPVGHIKYAWDKCSNIRIIVEPEKDVNIFDAYVSSFVSIENKRISDENFIEMIKKSGRFIVKGIGGCGKSVFMKWIWMKIINSDYNDKIPIFIQLRSLNGSSATVSELISYHIFRSPKGSDVIVKELMNVGGVIFILDGFDEIDYEIRERVEAEITSLAERYRGCSFVVSGRPDIRHEVWPGFKIAKMCPLQQGQSIKLIEKITFDDEIKSSFIEGIKGNKFEKHVKFLENPLLLLMMLITYKHFRDVPEKVHLFYQNAFEAMFWMHDSYKGPTFKRKLKSGLSSDIFQNVFSYFCLITYQTQQFEFGRTQVLKSIREALAFENVECVPEAYLHDLTECICLIQEEGLVLSFVHRSFQEYFTAVCLEMIPQSAAAKLIKEFSYRVTDNVIYLLHAKNKQLVRNIFFVPEIRRHKSFLLTMKSAKTYRNLIEEFDGEVTAGFRPSKRAFSPEIRKMPRNVLMWCSNISNLVELVSIMGTIKKCLTGNISEVARDVNIFEIDLDREIPSVKTIELKPDEMIVVRIRKDGAMVSVQSNGIEYDETKTKIKVGITECSPLLEKVGSLTGGNIKQINELANVVLSESENLFSKNDRYTSDLKKLLKRRP